MLEALIQLLNAALHREAAPAAPPPNRDAAQPPYRPELTERLRRSHCLLLQNLRRVAHAHSRRQHEACVAHLREFDFDLRAYLLGESAEFSSFLAARHVADPERLMQLRKIRARLRRLAREAHEIAYGHGAGAFEDGRTDYALAFAAMERTLRESLEIQEREFFDLYHPAMRVRQAAGG